MGVASAGISAGLGIYQAIKGSKEQRDASRALNEYQRQQLNNAYDNVQVSTRGADLQREEASRLASSQVDALQGGGTRALVGGLGRTETGNQRVNLGIGANLDEQQKAIDQMKAEDDVRIRMMQENREQNDINALSSQYQAGKQDMNMGLGNMVQGIGSVANSFSDAGKALATGGLSEIIPSGSSTPSNSLSTSVMTKTGGSGMGAVSGFGFDEFGNKIAQPTNTALAPKKKRFGFGYNENYDGTLNFN